MGQDTQTVERTSRSAKISTHPAALNLEPRRERLAAWLLGKPLALAVVLLCAAQLAVWVPHYLTWPWFADHDVFATLALGWDRGVLPYRDLAGNNFPGTIYVFWILGKLFGWGRTVPFYAVDAALLIGLGAAMLGWSRRRFGRVLPGAVGFAVFLTYYLGLDFTRVAQRDWHGPALMVLAILAAESWPGWGGWLASAMLAALAFAFRPQVVLLSPALLAAIAWREPREESRETPAVRSVLGWALVAGVFAVLAFLPLVWAGVGDAFVRGVRLAAYGSGYNKVSARTFTQQMLLQALHLEYLIVPAVIALLPAHRQATRRSIRVWSLALLGALLYKPLSPVPFPYLSHPLTLVWTISLCLMVQVVLEAEHASAGIRLAAVLLVLGLAVKLVPTYSSVRMSLEAGRALLHGAEPESAPLGYPEHTLDFQAVPYPWRDYRAVLNFLRRETPPETRVANLLAVVPALTGPTARLPALPAESLAWLAVKPDALGSFRRALEEAGDHVVVVWSPKEEGESNARLAPQVRQLAPIIRGRFEPAAQFGAIEVWKRKREPG